MSRLVILAVWVTLSPAPALSDGPFQATGIKIGEVTSNTAIVWTRLTQHPKRNPDKAPMVEIQIDPATRNRHKTQQVIKAVVYPKGATVADIRHAVPGAAGETRVRFRAEGQDEWTTTRWRPVDPDADFTRQFALNKLDPDTRYTLEVQARTAADDPVGSAVSGSFRTAPGRRDAGRVVFTVSTGQAYRDQDREDGFKIYPAMRRLDPSFFVHTGDIVYYDNLAKTEALAHYHWQRTYSLPTNVEFHRFVPSYFIKDDHDTWQNDCWPTMKNPRMGAFTFAQGVRIFPQQVPMGSSTYRTFRWGRDLQVWLVEGRDFRSPNPMKDGPGKTIWGEKQKAWFKKTVGESDATFRILISPTPVVGPDRTRKNDNHSNRGFTHEGDELRAFLASQRNMVVVCGDRHWQYFSVHPQTGLREYSCGPASDAHAGGWKQENFVGDYHKYLNVIGGFLSVTVERRDQEPFMTVRYHNVDGNVQFEDRLGGKP